MTVDPKPEMPKIVYAVMTMSGANTRTSRGGMGRGSIAERGEAQRAREDGDTIGRFHRTPSP